MILEIYIDRGTGDYPINFNIDLTDVNKSTIAASGGSVVRNGSHSGLRLGDCIVSKSEYKKGIPFGNPYFVGKLV